MGSSALPPELALLTYSLKRSSTPALFSSFLARVADRAYTFLVASSPFNSRSSWLPSILGPRMVASSRRIASWQQPWKLLSSLIDFLISVVCSPTSSRIMAISSCPPDTFSSPRSIAGPSSRLSAPFSSPPTCPTGRACWWESRSPWYQGASSCPAPGIPASWGVAAAVAVTRLLGGVSSSSSTSASRTSSLCFLAIRSINSSTPSSCSHIQSVRASSVRSSLPSQGPPPASDTAPTSFPKASSSLSCLSTNSPVPASRTSAVVSLAMLAASPEDGACEGSPGPGSSRIFLDNFFPSSTTPR